MKKIIALLGVVVFLLSMTPQNVMAMDNQGVIALGQTVTASEDGTWQIILPQSGEFRITGQVTGGNVGFKMYDVDNNRVCTWSQISSKTRDFSLWCHLESGVYYIEADKSLKGTYYFMTTFESANETYSYANDYYSDVKDKESIPFETEINGLIAENDSQDFYKLVLNESGIIRIAGQTYTDLQFGVCDEKGEWIECGYPTYKERDFEYTFALTAGTYYVLAKEKRYTGTYYFNVNFESAHETYTYVDNYPSDLTNVQPISFGNRINGILALNDRIDYYKVKLPVPGSIRLEGQNLTAGQVRCSVTNYYGKSYDYKYISGDVKDFTFVCDVDEGEQYIKIESEPTSVYRGYGLYNFTPQFYLYSPTNVMVTSKNARSFTVKCQKASAISGYELEYKKAGASWKNLAIAGDKNLRKTIKGLKKGTYQIKIRSYYEADGQRFVSDYVTTSVRVRK